MASNDRSGSGGSGGGGAGDDRFAYKTMASIVHKQDRKDVIRDEPSGESERVSSSQLKHEMGAALKPSTSLKRAAKPSGVGADQAAVRRAATNYEDLLRAGGTYEPTTRVTERAWESFLTLISGLLPTAERDVLRSAAEESLNVLKSTDLFTAQQRRVQLELLLDCKLKSDDEYRALLTCAEQLTDFVVQGTASKPQQPQQRKDMEIPIVFEDDDDAADGAAAEDGDAKAEDGGEQLANEVVSLDGSDDEDDSRAAAIHSKSAPPPAAATAGSSSLLVDPITIDAFWLQRELSKHHLGDNNDDDAGAVQRLAEEVLHVFGGAAELGGGHHQVENHLVGLLGYDQFDLTRLLLRNRVAIHSCTMLHRAKSEDERERVRDGMRATEEGRRVLAQLSGTLNDKQAVVKSAVDAAAARPEEQQPLAAPQVRPSGRLVDLARLQTRQSGSRATATAGGEVLLPKGSWRKTNKNSEEVHVPAPVFSSVDASPRVTIASLPAWMQPAFAGMSELNLVQSRVYPAVMLEEDRCNLLVSAPTSAGKTNIAMLAILRELAPFVDAGTGELDVARVKAEVKIVYVAPMKALVQEVVQNFSHRLGSSSGYTLQVRELSGDSQLSREQIKDTQLIVTTPEKWDVVSRKAGERSFVAQVKLVIVDEIHLLNDTRGAVLEAVIARILYNNSSSTRILGISATLPNYVDVARFLRVPLDRGMFYFDASYRPVPLQQVFVGVTDQKALTRAKHLDQLCFDKVCDSAQRGHQVLVFVHSRKSTVRLARLFQQRAEETDRVDVFLPGSAAGREVLQREEVRTAELKPLLPYGLAVHHAGMAKQDRALVEDLFAAGHIRVLVCTATLAWGVNLPAHTVIIAGTQVYSPELAAWTELPQLDLLQMLGRAGRPQFDTEGEGIVLTTHSEMLYYLTLCNNQLQVESALLLRLPEHINAEVVIGNISSLEDAVRWLGFTYLHHRAQQQPSKYGVADADNFHQWEVDVCHAALLQLDGMNLVHYDHRHSFQVQGTALGRITSHYYLSPDTMSNFCKVLDASSSATSLMDLVRILTVADEFKQITVRHEEKLELAKLADRVPLPIREPLEEPSAKVNILLQAYICNWALDGYCLRCDLVYVHQSASRLARALFELCLHRKLASASLAALSLCQSLDRQLWRSQSPLRQLKLSAALDENDDVLRQLERKSLSWPTLHALSPVELAALVRSSSNARQLGQQLHQAIHRLPRVELQARAQTLSRSSIQLDLAINADFEFDVPTLFGGGSSASSSASLLFWVLVMDADGQQLLHREQFTLKSRFAEEEHLVRITLGDLPEPWPLFVLVKVEADSFLHTQASLAVPLHSLTQPKKALPFTELLDLSPVPTSSLANAQHRRFFLEQHITELWPTQAQTYAVLNGMDSVVVALPVGKTVLAELAMLRTLELDANARILYLHSNEHAVQVKLDKWQALFAQQGEVRVGRLRGVDVQQDLQVLRDCHVVVSTAAAYEQLSRKWKQKARKVVYELSLVVCDDVHINTIASSTDMELCVSRLRYMAVHLERPIRLLGLCGSVLNGEDVASWMGNAKLVSLPPSARPHATELNLVSFAETHYETRQGLMIRPAFRAATASAGGGGGRVFVFFPSKRHVKLALVDFIQLLSSDKDEGEESAAAGDAMLRLALRNGLSVVHEHLSAADLALAQQGGQIVLVSVPAVWRLRDDFVCQHAIVAGTSWFKNKRFEEYPAWLVQKLVNKAVVVVAGGGGGKCRQTVMCSGDANKDVLKRYLSQGALLESQLLVDGGGDAFGDVLLGELCTSKTVKTKQDAVDFFTWTLFYRRLLKNPSYYYHGTASSSSSFLSEIVDNAVNELRECQCLEDEEEGEDEDGALKPTSLGLIAAFHDVKCNTVELFSSSLEALLTSSSSSQQQPLKPARVFDLVSSASEFIGRVELRAREELVLDALCRNSTCVSLPIPSLQQQGAGNGLVMTETHVKVNVLLQCWCNNKLTRLQQEQRDDLVQYVLPQVPKLLHALVDLAASQGALAACVSLLETCQTVVQQVWQTESVLKQIPYWDELAAGGTAAQLRTVYDVIEMEDEARDALLRGMQADKVQAIATFCNTYPSVNVRYQCVGGGEGGEEGVLRAGQPVQIVVQLEQDDGEEEAVVSQRFPLPKTNLWWAMLGGREEGGGEKNTLLAIKRVNNKQATLSCEFATPGTKRLQLIVMCDSYLGCDQQLDLELNVI